jgi:hypothetical protein
VQKKTIALQEINMMDGCVNAFLKRFKFLDFDESVKKRIQPDQYFCQPFVAQHLDWSESFSCIKLCHFLHKIVPHQGLS